MASQSIVAGSTSVSVTIFVQDSSSTVGAGLAGLAFNTSGLIAYYTFDGVNAAATAITLATLAAVGSAYSSGGFKEIDATNMKGGYRLDIPNAALAASKGRAVTIALSGATNMAPCWMKIELTGWDNQDGVRGGMTALPNAAANAAGGLPVSTAGGLDLDEMNVDIEAIQTSTAGLTFTGAGKVDASVRDWIGGTIPAVNVTGVPLVDLKYTLGTISPAAAGSVGIDWAQVANKGSTVSLTATTIATLTTYTGDTPQTGDAFARIGATGSGLTTITGLLPTALSGGLMKCDMLAINTDATSAANIAKTTKVIGRGTASGVPTTTSVPTSAMTPAGAVADQFKGRIITFDANTSTAALQGQATDITASSNSATPTFTVTALTTAPAAGDTFSVT